MKPNFALSLSFEGIGLLARAQDGWTRVADVALDVPNLAKALADLRAKADAIGPDDGAARLIIPNEQIRYLDIPDTGLQGDALTDAIAAALEGATPYAVADLAFDWTVSQGKVLIAAVARETLAEAEMFASGHSFVPVCFVARAPDDAFEGEVFFGPAKGWKGPAPRRADQAIRIVEAAPIKTAPQPAATPAEAPTPKPAAPKVEPPKPVVAPPVAAKPVADTPKPVPAPAAPPQEDIPAAKPGFASIRASRTGATPPAAPKLSAPTTKPAAAATPPITAKAEPADTTKPRVSFNNKPVSVTEARIPDVSPESSASFAKTAVNFLSRRRAKKIEPEVTAPVAGTVAAPSAAKPVEPPKPVRTSALLAKRKAAPAAAVADGPADPAALERERMTVFGAREKARVGGKPRFLGLMLTATLLLFLLGVAAWASVFLDDGLARFFQEKDEPATAIALAPLDLTPDADLAEGEEATIELAALDTGEATLDDAPTALPLPEVALPAPVLTPEEAEATYAATGYWVRAPTAPDLPPLGTVEEVYIPSIDAVIPPTDALALVNPRDLETDFAYASPPNPVPPGVTFDFDDRGLVKAVPEGAMNPDGVLIFAGRPPLVAPLRPAAAALLNESPEALAERARLQAARPKARPDDILEQNERATLGGFTRSELADVRPKARTATAKEAAERNRTATAQAVQTSVKPLNRPRNFEAIVERAQKEEPAAQPVQVAAAVAPKTVAPKIPSSSSVTKAATVKNALNLRKINLIGVYGKPQSRRALVRLANGRYKKVKVGDSLDGGRVAAIGENALRYTKNGRNLSIELPK